MGFRPGIRLEIIRADIKPAAVHPAMFGHIRSLPRLRDILCTHCKNGGNHDCRRNEHPFHIPDGFGFPKIGKKQAIYNLT
jgi:hypothetical protein